MKKLIIITICFLSFEALAQDDNKGKVFSTLFWNFNSDFTKDASKKKAFEIKRAYLGYNYKIDDKLSTKITFDIGKNSSGSSYTAFLNRLHSVRPASFCLSAIFFFCTGATAAQRVIRESELMSDAVEVSHAAPSEGT